MLSSSTEGSPSRATLHRERELAIDLHGVQHDRDETIGTV
jgi:hypothetical protein